MNIEEVEEGKLYEINCNVRKGIYIVKFIVMWDYDASIMKCKTICSPCIENINDTLYYIEDIIKQL